MNIERILTFLFLSFLLIPVSSLAQKMIWSSPFNSPQNKRCWGERIGMKLVQLIK